MCKANWSIPEGPGQASGEASQGRGGLAQCEAGVPESLEKRVASTCTEMGERGERVTGRGCGVCRGLEVGQTRRGLVGRVRPAGGEEPWRAFRQAGDATDTNALGCEPPHGPDTNTFSPTHTSRSCQASVDILAHGDTHPFAPPGRAAEKP